MPHPGLRSWNVALAAVAAVALIVEASLRSSGGLSPSAYVLSVAAAAPLAWRTLTPVGALVGVEVGALAWAVAFDATDVATAMVVIELYTVALLGDRRRSIVVGGTTAIGVMVAIVLIDGYPDLGGVAIRVSMVFATLALGDTVRTRRELRAAARERAEREAHEREQEDHRRAADERMRIARELHDTLAHSLVAINVRAGVALDLGESQEPTSALQDIKKASSNALRDLRATLNLLRDEGDTAPTAPAFGLEGLQRLVDHARSAGLLAEVDVQINGAAVPSAIGGAAVRIVQESLTNVLRHADATHAQVRVRARTDALDVEITDDGRAENDTVSPGLGLRGMSERATALGGRVDVGPCAGGGWRVRAVLPLKGAER